MIFLSGKVYYRRDVDNIMVSDFVSKLQEMADDGILSCVQIVGFARNNDIQLHTMKPILNAAGIQVKDCERTCISYKCKYFKQEEPVTKPGWGNKDSPPGQLWIPRLRKLQHQKTTCIA